MNMTPKMFLLRAGQNAATRNPRQFLNENREFLAATLGDAGKEVLDGFAVMDIMPTAALISLKTLMEQVVYNQTIAKAEAELTKQPRKKAADRPWVVELRWVADGTPRSGIVKDEVAFTKNSKNEKDPLRESFDRNADAERWLNRKLMENPNTRAELKFKDKLMSSVDRDTGIRNMKKTSPSAAMKRIGTRVPTKASPWMKVGTTKVTHSPR